MYPAKLTLALFSMSLASLVAEPGKQIETSLKIDDEVSIPYLQYLPKGFVKGEKKKWPLMLFLHGRGESNGPLSKVKVWGPPKMVDSGKDLPYIVISPQCPKSSWWSNDDQQELLVKLLAHVRKEFPIDDSRIYLTGLSMGGYGSWALSAKMPNTFAAVMPICGGGDPKDAEKLKGLPIWVWHGTDDGAVPFSKSVEMVDAIKKAGGKKIKFTKLEGVGHNSWSAAYKDPKTWEWFAENQRKTDEKK